MSILLLLSSEKCEKAKIASQPSRLASEGPVQQEHYTKGYGLRQVHVVKRG
jgi:hypothetical protein